MDRSRRRLARIVCLTALVLVAASAAAQNANQDGGSPSILSRETKIYVNHDGSLDVSETTIVNAAAPKEFHRDLSFPGRRIKASDIFMEDAYEVDPSVTYVYQTNGQTNARVSQLGDGVRISVQPTSRVGPRKFQLDYRVLYGVTGHHGNNLYWLLASASNHLPVQQASLHVALPEDTPSDQIHAHFQLDGVDAAPADNPVSGTRVSLAFPDAVAPGQTLAATISYGNAAPLASASGVPAWTLDGRIWLAILALYYLIVKFAFTGSRDNKPVIPEYEPPSGWSATALRLLWRNGYDHKCFTTGILGVAAKGGLTISKQTDGTWVATRAGADEIPALTLDERALRSALFTFNHTVAFTGPNADSLDVAETSFRGILEKRCASALPMSLAGLLIPSWLVAVIGAVYLYSFGRNPAYLAAELIGATAVAAIALVVLAKVLPGGLLRAIKVQGAFAAVICIGAWFANTDTAHWLWMVALLGGQTAAAWWLLRQHGKETPLLRQIRGFRWYLGTAEQQDMQARFKPSLHPELQASLLPYAMALDVEVAWNARFARTVGAAEQQGFIAGMNRESADHAEAALDLLNFAQAMSMQARTRTATAAADTSGT